MSVKRLGRVSNDILKWIATGAILLIVLGSPVGGGKISNLLWKKTRKALSNYVRRRLREMEEAGYIITQGGTIKLTAAGKKQLARATIEDIEFDTSVWDHKWRCIAYDVPNIFTKSRNAFRRTLTKWSFYQIQKSVFVFPYACTEQVAVVARYYNIERYVLIMEANDLPTSKKLRSHFNL